MTLLDNLLAKTKYGRKELARQELIISVTEQIWAALEERSMNKAELAKALESSKSHVTQLLSGERNMTLSTLADIGEAVGAKPRIIFDLAKEFKHQNKWDISSGATAAASPNSNDSVIREFGKFSCAQSAKVPQKPVSVSGALGAHATVQLVLE